LQGEKKNAINKSKFGSAEKAGFLARFFFRTAFSAGRVISMGNEIEERVSKIALPILQSENLELVDIEYRREARGWVLRLFIDREGGVTLNDCARTSEEIGRVLDVEDFITNPYTLEVSSPGLNRVLKKESDFVKYRGRQVQVKTYEPIGNRRRFKGKLLGLSADREVEIEVEGGIFHIPLSNIAKANLEVVL